jgi:hypothetical protein
MSTIKFEISRTVNFKFSHFVPDTTLFEHNVQGTQMCQPTEGPYWKYGKLAERSYNEHYSSIHPYDCQPMLMNNYYMQYLLHS